MHTFKSTQNIIDFLLEEHTSISKISAQPIIGNKHTKEAKTLRQTYYDQYKASNAILDPTTYFHLLK